MTVWLRDHRLAVILVASIGTSASAMWVAEWGPFADVGGHVVIMDAFARGADPATAYPATFVVASQLGPNVLSCHLARLMHPILDASQSARIALSLYAVGLPLSLLALCVSFRRNPWLSLAGVPLTHSAMLAMGALNFLLGLPLLFFSIAAARAWIDRGGITGGVGVTALLLASYLAHLYTGAMACGFVFVLLTLHASREHPLRHLVLVPASAAVLAWLWGVHDEMSVGGTLGIEYRSLGERLGGVHDWGLRFFRHVHGDEVSALTLVLLLAASFWTAERPRARTAKEGVLAAARRHDFRIVTAFAIVGWLVLPDHLARVHVVGQRLVIVIWILFALWAPAPVEPSPDNLPKRRVALALGTVLATLALGYPAYAGFQFARFEREVVGELPDAIRALPPATTLAYANIPNGNHLTCFSAPWHIPSGVHAVDNGGVMNVSFARRPYSAVRYRPGAEPRFSVVPEHNLARADYALWRGGESPPPEVLQRTRLVFHGGPWWLYEVVHAGPHRGRSVL